MYIVNVKSYTKCHKDKKGMKEAVTGLLSVPVSKTSVRLKSSKIIKCTQTVFVDNFRNTSTNSLIQVSVCGGSYGRYMKHKRNDPVCDPWDPQWDEKMQFLFLLLFALTF